MTSIWPPRKSTPNLWEIEYPDKQSGYTNSEGLRNEIMEKLVNMGASRWHKYESRLKIIDAMQYDGGAVMIGKKWVTKGCKLLLQNMLMFG
jgi:hypothetical protein